MKWICDLKLKFLCIVAMETEAGTKMATLHVTKNGDLPPQVTVLKKNYSFDNSQDDSKMPLYERQSSVRRSQSMTYVGRNLLVS